MMHGHAFEMDSLHDQAMAVYLDLSKTMPGSFLPLLYVGVEYLHMDNTILAERYIKNALQLSSNDPLVLHELAIVHFQKKEYVLCNAIVHFHHGWLTYNAMFRYQTALDRFEEVLIILSENKIVSIFPEKWEPLINNMGHVCRKLGNYERAITLHYQALQMVPENASTYDAIGFIYKLQNKLKMACDFFQKVTF